MRSPYLPTEKANATGGYDEDNKAFVQLYNDVGVVDKCNERFDEAR